MTIQELRALLSSGRCEEWKDDIVRLIVPVDLLAKKDVAKLIQDLRAASGVRSLTPIPRRDVAVVPRAPVHGGMTPAELVREYVKARSLEGVDAATVERAGLELLVERDEGDRRVM